LTGSAGSAGARSSGRAWCSRFTGSAGETLFTGGGSFFSFWSTNYIELRKYNRVARVNPVGIDDITVGFPQLGPQEGIR
jgi:hypothetical protein